MPKQATRLNQLREETESFGKEVQAKILGYITAAFGLVAGLAWNDAIKALIESYFPQGEGDLVAKFMYAIVISLIVVTITIYLSKLVDKKKKK